MGYMGVYAGPAGPMPVTSVAAPPLAYTGPAPQAPSHSPSTQPQCKKESLISELTSFYSDIASLDSNSRDATEDDTSQVFIVSIIRLFCSVLLIYFSSRNVKLVVFFRMQQQLSSLMSNHPHLLSLSLWFLLLHIVQKMSAKYSKKLLSTCMLKVQAQKLAQKLHQQRRKRR